MLKIEEWVEASRGRIRVDKAHGKLLGLGYAGSERSTRRAIAQVKAAWRLGHTRVAWLAFSRFRIVIPLRDRTAPSVFAALDRCFRVMGGHRPMSQTWCQ